MKRVKGMPANAHAVHAGLLFTCLLLSNPAIAAIVKGHVKEFGTGDPVVGASVQASGVTTSTDNRGAFALEIPDGSAVIIIDGLTHLPAEIAIQVPPKEDIVLFVKPAEGPNEIVVESDRDSPHTSRQMLDRERVQKTPGTHDDPIRLIQALPGVVATREYSPAAGDLAIRGSAPSESRVFLDGVEIPYLYHFQQYASVIHTRLLDEVNVYPSAFGAEYGNAIGGVAAVETRDADPIKLHGGANANLIMAGGYLMAPTSDTTSVATSARRSFMDLAESESDQYTVWPAFWDYLGRTEWRPSGNHKVRLTAIGAGDRYGRYAGDTAEMDPLEAESAPAFVLDRGFHSIIAQSNHTTSKASFNTTLGWVSDQWDGSLGDTLQQRQEQTLNLRHHTTMFESEDYLLRLGGDGRWVNVHRFTNTEKAWPELAFEAPMLARGIAVDEHLKRLQGGVWVEPRIDLGATRVQPGLRLQADSAIKKARLEPRLGTRVTLSDSVRVRAAAGRYSQAPSLDALSSATGDPSLPMSTSDQAALGFDLTVADRWEWGLEGWGRSIQNAVDESPDTFPTVADGWAAGVEITSRYRMRDHFFSWLSLTLGHATRDGTPFDYDQPYAFNFVTSWDFRPLWNIGLRYRAAAGLPYTPIVDSIYEGDDDTYTAVYGSDNSERLPDYQKVDFHLEREIPFRRWTVAAYLEAWWVPPGSNVLYPVYSYDYSKEALVIGPAFVPLVGVRAEI